MGRSSSRIRKIAPETESAQTQKTTITVAFRGAKRPKLAKMMQSQNTRIPRNGNGIELPRLPRSKPRLSYLAGQRQGLGAQRALVVISRRQCLDRVIDSFDRICGRLTRYRRVTIGWPKPLDRCSHRTLEQGPT